MKTKQSPESTTAFHEIVLKQLGKILMHPLFLSSGILTGFLKFIVHETLAGRQDQIKEYTIALHVLHKPASFLPAFDAIVRIHAKRLRNALSAYYDQEGLTDDCLIIVPKGRYVPVFERTDHLQLSKKPEASSLHKTASKKNRIAFMPFKTYDRNIFHSSFVDNLAEELTRQFSDRSELSVLSYHTTRLLSPKQIEIKKLVASYHIQYLISGSIRFEHSNIKTFAELIDTTSENQIWSGVYYQTAVASQYFRAIDDMASELMSDLSKIKSLACDTRAQTDILYIDSYGKKEKSVRLLAGM